MLPIVEAWARLHDITISEALKELERRMIEGERENARRQPDAENISMDTF